VTSNGQPVSGAKEVALRFTPTIANLAPSQAELTDNGNGLYTARGAYLSLPDNGRCRRWCGATASSMPLPTLVFRWGGGRGRPPFLAPAERRLAGGRSVLIYFALTRIPWVRGACAPGELGSRGSAVRRGSGGVLPIPGCPELRAGEPNRTQFGFGGARPRVVHRELRALPRRSRQGRWASGPKTLTGFPTGGASRHFR